MSQWSNVADQNVAILVKGYPPCMGCGLPVTSVVLASVVLASQLAEIGPCGCGLDIGSLNIWCGDDRFVVEFTGAGAAAMAEAWEARPELRGGVLWLLLTESFDPRRN